jgi:hypothetical protein
MAYIKIEVDDKILATTEWAIFSPPSTEKFPRIYRIVDGGAKLHLTHTYNFWISKEQLAALPIETDLPQDICSAPNLGFSEGFILRALAIAQDPKLAKELV